MKGDQSPDVLLAFDFGLRRIGVASGNLRTRTASPVTTLTVGSDLPWVELDRTIDEWQPGQLVVGLPGSTSPNDITARIGDFIDALRGRYEIPVESVDESYTSRTAQADLRDARRSGSRKKRVRKGLIDSHAACLIAEQWMKKE